ncbi:hypothetical protein ACPF7Z_11820 [Halomonas sp. GXIMD04776]|uniref:hypothetical protein n=1 Tax=Halomonas sp. GXIMD04776 TaxID=3415605 RepID=UPI003CC3C927
MNRQALQKSVSINPPLIRHQDRKIKKLWRETVRKIRIIEHISLDGVIQAPGGPDPFPIRRNEPTPKIQGESL